jgi:transcriptional regulator with XRE-family HTH domain
MITIGEKIKMILKRKGMTSETMAASLGITRQRLHHIYQQTFVNDDLADKFTEILGLDKSELDPYRMSKAETSIVQINGGNGKQNVSLSEKDLYAQLLASKDSEILLLRDLVEQLKRQLIEK